MSDYHEQLEAAIRATVFHSSTTYSWFGKRSPKLPSSVRRALTPQTARNYLLFSLQSRLYEDFYCQGFATPDDKEGPKLRMSAGMTPFVAALSAANAGGGYWQGGWEVFGVEDGAVVVQKGLRLWVRPEDCHAPEGEPVEAGARVSLRFPKEFFGRSPGFYVAAGNEPLDEDGSQPLVRFYWNLTVDSAVRFLREATSTLNRAGLPFSLKVLNDPAGFTRCDAAVVYVHKRDYEAAAQRLASIYPDISVGLKQGCPAFAKAIAPGLGLAENPGPSESFGMHRCWLVAEGMVRAHEEGDKSVDKWLQTVAARFAEEGLSLEKPYLNPGSSNDYTFEVAKS
jgi:HopA1 effector protein family